MIIRNSRSKIKKEWDDLDKKMIRQYMRYDFRSLSLYEFGKNISNLTDEEKDILLSKVLSNFWNSGYQKYGKLFLDCYIKTFDKELRDIEEGKRSRKIYYDIMGLYNKLKGGKYRNSILQKI